MTSRLRPNRQNHHQTHQCNCSQVHPSAECGMVDSSGRFFCDGQTDRGLGDFRRLDVAFLRCVHNTMCIQGINFRNGRPTTKLVHQNMLVISGHKVFLPKQKHLLTTAHRRWSDSRWSEDRTPDHHHHLHKSGEASSEAAFPP